MSNFNDPSSPLPPPPVVTMGGGPSVPSTSGKAICLCYGVIAVPCGILAIVFSKMAFADVAAGRAGPGGNGMAKAGNICGIVGICLAVLYIIAMAIFIGFAISSGAATSGGGGYP
jgi:hypothetical protein